MQRATGDDDELVTDLLRVNWCNEFWPYVSLVIIDMGHTSAALPVLLTYRRAVNKLLQWE